MESRKFEDGFKNAFDEAELDPSDNVWTNIELDLEKSEGGKMKRRLMVFQWLTAASIAFALGVAGMGYSVLHKNMDADQTAINNAANRKASPSSAASTVHDESDITSTQDALSQQSQANNQNDSSADNFNTESSVLGGNQEESGSVPSSSPVTSDQNLATKGGNETLVTRAGNVPTTQGDLAQNNAAGMSNSRAISKDNTAQSTRATGEQIKARANGDERAYQPQKDKRYASSQKKSEAELNQLALSETSTPTNKNPRTTKAVTSANHNDSANPLKAIANNSSATVDRDKLPANVTGTSATSRAKSIGRSSLATSGTRQDKDLQIASSENVRAQNQTDPILNNTLFNSASSGNGSLSYAQSSHSITKVPARVPKPVDATAAEADPVAMMMARLSQREREIADEDDKKEDAKKKDDDVSEKLWTSLGFAAGSFNSVNASVSPSVSSSFASNNVASQQAKANGSAYSVGVSMGTKLSSRWVVQGGVNYMTQTSDYTASAVSTADFASFRASSVNSMMASADNVESKTVQVSPYSVNNNIRFMSVPLQAGYLVVNRKFGVQLNGGVSTDLFLQNTITPESDNLARTTQRSGSDSPYRTVNFSGLVGTELSYRVGTHYRVAVNPGIRYPFNSIYKSDQPIAANPLTFDVGLKFRYIFH